MSAKKQETYTERELVEGCIKNDRLCQELLFKRFFPVMFRMCFRRTNDQELAKDIVNRGFLRVFKKINTFSFKGSLEGWIRRLVYHSLCDHFKENSRELQVLVFEERDASIHGKVLEQMYFNDLLKLVESLPPATKTVFKLYTLEGLTHPEISTEINISVGTSKWHLSNAREKLKHLIENNAQYKFYAR